MSITNDTIDATIATLRETRDGLLQTEQEEQQQWDAKMAELTKIAHEWADKNGMGDSVEELLEELGLPGRPDHRHVTLGDGGYVTITTLLPYRHPSSTQMPRIVDSYDPVAVTQRTYLGAELTLQRDASDNCICSHAVLMDLLGITRIQAVDENPEMIVMIEADLSCDSPRCHHGYGEPVAQVPEVETVDDGVQHCTYTGHSDQRHQHVRDGNGGIMYSDLSHSGDWGVMDWQTLPGTFIKMTRCTHANHTPDVPHVHHRFDTGVVTMTPLDADAPVSDGVRQEGVFMRRMPACGMAACDEVGCERPL